MDCSQSASIIEQHAHSSDVKSTIAICDENFTLLLETNIPELVQSSPHLQSLLENEQLPQCGIAIPRGCLKQNTKISDKNDLFELLHTMRYWMLPDETLYQSPDFFPFCLDPENTEAMAEACDEFGNEIADLKGLLLLAETENTQKVACAANERPPNNARRCTWPDSIRQRGLFGVFQGARFRRISRSAVWLCGCSGRRWTR